jgi:hypothetical protein
VSDRHPDHDLLAELEPVAERLLDRHLAMAKDWLPTSTCLEPGPRRRCRALDPDQPRLTGVAQAGFEVTCSPRTTCPATTGNSSPPSAATGPGGPGRTAGPPRRAATRSCSATICWSPATSTRSPWNADAWPPCSRGGCRTSRRWACWPMPPSRSWPPGSPIATPAATPMTQWPTRSWCGWPPMRTCT